MTTKHRTTQGIDFKIVTTDNDIIFIDSNHATICWDNTLENHCLVDAMVYDLETLEIG